jgi:hypothetical protein
MIYKIPKAFCAAFRPGATALLPKREVAMLEFTIIMLAAGSIVILICHRADVRRQRRKMAEKLRIGQGESPTAHTGQNNNGP